jgi:hypothetical protein
MHLLLEACLRIDQSSAVFFLASISIRMRRTLSYVHMVIALVGAALKRLEYFSRILE